MEVNSFTNYAKTAIFIAKHFRKTCFVYEVITEVFFTSFNTKK